MIVHFYIRRKLDIKLWVPVYWNETFLNDCGLDLYGSNKPSTLVD